MSKHDKQKRLEELRAIRNYVIDVIACGVAQGHLGQQGGSEGSIVERKMALAVQEEKIMEILDAD